MQVSRRFVEFLTTLMALSAGAAEYTDWISAEG